MEVRSATTDEMVLAFVRAEMDSPTERGKLFLDVLARICADRATLIDHADLRNPQQNYARRRILGEARGAAPPTSNGDPGTGVSCPEAASIVNAYAQHAWTACNE